MRQNRRLSIRIIAKTVNTNGDNTVRQINIVRSFEQDKCLHRKRRLKIGL